MLELDLVGVCFVNVHVCRDIVADPMIDELLMVFRALKLEQMLEVFCMLFLERFDFFGDAVDRLDWGWFGFAELAQCLGSHWDSVHGQSWREDVGVRWNVGAFGGEDVLRETDVSERRIVWMSLVDGPVRFTKAIFSGVSWVCFATSHEGGATVIV